MQPDGLIALAYVCGLSGHGYFSFSPGNMLNAAARADQGAQPSLLPSRKELPALCER